MIAVLGHKPLDASLILPATLGASLTLLLMALPFGGPWPLWASVTPVFATTLASALAGVCAEIPGDIRLGSIFGPAVAGAGLATDPLATLVWLAGGDGHAPPRRGAAGRYSLK